MMAIIAVAVFLAFVSVFMRDKKEKKRLANSAQKSKKGDGGNIVGMLLGGVAGAVLDLSEDDYSDAEADDNADHGAPLVRAISGVGLARATSAAAARAAVRGFKSPHALPANQGRTPSLERAPPALPPPDMRKRHNISENRALSAATPPRTRQGTPPRTRQSTPPRDVEYLSDEWYELYGKKAKQSKTPQDSAVDAIEREARLMAEQTSFDQDGCVALRRSPPRLLCQLLPPRIYVYSASLLFIYLLHLVRVALSRADRTQSGTASWTRNSLNRLSRRPRSPQISKPMIKHQCRVGRIRPATRKAKKKRGSLQRLWHRVRDPCCTIACAVLSLPSAVSTLRPADNPCSLMTFVDFR